MPIIKSAKKANEASLRKHVFNVRRTRVMKMAIKEIKELSAKGEKVTDEMLTAAYKAIDKAAKRGIIKSNNANRKKSNVARIAAKVVEKVEKKKKEKVVKEEKTTKKETK